MPETVGSTPQFVPPDDGTEFRRLLADSAARDALMRKWVISLDRLRATTNRRDRTYGYARCLFLLGGAYGEYAEMRRRCRTRGPKWLSLQGALAEIRRVEWFLTQEMLKGIS